MKIAQFRCTNPALSQRVCVLEEGDLASTLPMYSRISEWVEVEFPQLPPESYLPHQLETLAREEQELREKLTRVTAVRASLQPTT